uniref:Uncharacterized protein n=1 Tax=Kalanchoe fedtschenkoi TaxID=63787 RepID=A0A7N0TVM1_KALFE
MADSSNSSLIFFDHDSFHNSQNSIHDWDNTRALDDKTTRDAKSSLHLYPASQIYVCSNYWLLRYSYWLQSHKPVKMR